MLKTNVRDRIRQTNYFLARLSKQCLQVYAEHSGQLQISQLASTMSCLPHTYYSYIDSLARIRDIASQLSTYSVCSSKGKIARQLDKASMLARQIAHNTAVELHQPLSQQLDTSKTRWTLSAYLILLLLYSQQLQLGTQVPPVPSRIPASESWQGQLGQLAQACLY